MLLRCSRGCEYDVRPGLLYNYLRPGDRCPMVLDYDRLRGSIYCRRKLRLVDGAGDADVDGANGEDTKDGAR